MIEKLAMLWLTYFKHPYLALLIANFVSSAVYINTTHTVNHLDGINMGVFRLIKCLAVLPLLFVLVLTTHVVRLQLEGWVYSGAATSFVANNQMFLGIGLAIIVSLVLGQLIAKFIICLLDRDV